MVLCQDGEAAAVPAAGGKEPEVSLSREDGTGTGQPCLCPAPGMEAAGAEERRVCGCCSGLSWPRCCKAPGEEGESGKRGRRGSALPAGLPALGVILPAGRRKRKRPRGHRGSPHAAAGRGASSGGRRGRPAPVPAPPLAARGRQAAASPPPSRPRLWRLTPGARRVTPGPLRACSTSPLPPLLFTGQAGP